MIGVCGCRDGTLEWASEVCDKKDATPKCVELVSGGAVVCGGRVDALKRTEVLSGGASAVVCGGNVGFLEVV